MSLKRMEIQSKERRFKKNLSKTNPSEFCLEDLFKPNPNGEHAILIINDNSTTKQSVLKKLNALYKKGYLPARQYQTYKVIRQSDMIGIESLINCFAHSCFNLTNNIIIEQNFTPDECACFGEFSLDIENPKLFESSFFEFLNQAGLQIQVCSPTQKLDENQWKIALMFCKDGFDFHFLLQEKDGSWSSKCGRTERIDKLPTLPNVYQSEVPFIYHLYQTYAITNPYANKHSTASNDKCEKEKAG